jgi:hypothetical protein
MADESSLASSLSASLVLTTDGLIDSNASMLNDFDTSMTFWPTSSCPVPKMITSQNLLSSALFYISLLANAMLDEE